MPVRRAPSVRPQRRLSRELIADTAMGILDAEGLDAVTMRRVAQELGTGPASLYAHVENKLDLYAVLVEQAIGEVELPPPSEDWQESVKDFVRLVRLVFSRHRDLARANLGTIPTGPNAMRAADHLLGVLRGARLPDQICAWAVDILSLYGTAAALEDREDLDDAYHEDVHDQFRALPADRFPNLAALADALVEGDDDERFEFGLGLLVAGLATHAPR